MWLGRQRDRVSADRPTRWRGDGAYAGTMYRAFARSMRWSHLACLPLLLHVACGGDSGPTQTGNKDAQPTPNRDTGTTTADPDAGAGCACDVNPAACDPLCACDPACTGGADGSASLDANNPGMDATGPGMD